MIGTIEIPKTNVKYPIIEKVTKRSLEKAVAVEWPQPDPVLNEVGNVVIAGHNYRNNRFFSKVPTLSIGDRIRITDAEGKKINYTVFDKYEVKPSNTECIEDVPGKENKRIVTIITCTNDSKKRVIVQAEAN